MPRIRYLIVGAALASSCASDTFDLLPNGPAADDGGEGGDWFGGHEGGESGAVTLPPSGSGGGAGSGGGGGGGGGKSGDGGAGYGGKAPVAGSFGIAGAAGVSGTGPKPEGRCERKTDCERFTDLKECHPEWGVCVECYNEYHCAENETCDLYASCQPSCDGREDCPPHKPECAASICVECEDSIHCKNEREPVCRGFYCLPCRVDPRDGTDDCPDGKQCYQGQCLVQTMPRPDPPPP